MPLSDNGGCREAAARIGRLEALRLPCKPTRCAKNRRALAPRRNRTRNNRAAQKQVRRFEPKTLG